MNQPESGRTTKPILSAFADESSETFAEQLAAVKRNGITHIEIRRVDGQSIHQLSDQALHQIKQQADDAGIGFSALGSALGKCDVNGNMIEQKEMCRRLVDIAGLLETRYIRMFSFRIPKEQSPVNYRQQVIDQLAEFVTIAENTPVILAHENENHIYGETADRCLDLYQTFTTDGRLVGIFDFANFVQAGQRPLTDCWPLLKDHTAYFHIKDARLADGQVVPAGQGDGGLPEILSEVLHNGFDSFLTLEPHLWPKHFEGDANARFDLASSALQELLTNINKGTHI